MAKNMTFKGLAFGAGIALVVSGFSAVPANAAGNGLVGYVTLAADGGTHTNVLTTDTLDLKANFSPAVNEVSGRNLKFLVTDPNSTSTADASRSNSNSSTLAAGAITAEIATNKVVITETNAGTNTLVENKTFVGYGATDATDKAKFNDQVFTGLNGDSTADRALTGDDGDLTVTGVTIEGTSGKMSRAGLVATSLGKSLESGYAIASAIGGVSTTDGRDTAGSYVVTSTIYQAGADVILRLASNSALTQTQVVTAWIDTDGDNVIDSTEYASPDVTVKFLAPTDVTPTLTLDPIGINDISVKARTTFSPELNMTQTGDVQVGFTRQGFAETLVATGDDNIEAAAQVGATSTWASTVTMYNNASNDPWTSATGRQAIVTAVDTVTAAKSGSTVTLSVATHGMNVGDIIKVTNGDAAVGQNLFFTVLTVASTTVLTYDVGNTTAASDVSISISRVGTAAAAGTYSARVILDGVLVGSAVYQTTGTTSVAGLANEVTVATGVASTGAVRVGNTGAVTITASATKADTTAAASVPVLVTATSVSSAGTILVNGVKAAANGTWNLTTDALGQVALVVTNSSAVASEAITLQVATQGQTATTTLTWTAAVYKLYDLNVLDGWQSGRTIEAGGSYTFDLALLDQWKEAPTAGSYQVKVTTDNRTVGAQYVALTGGRAMFTLTDGGIGSTMYSDVTVDVEYKAATATVFSSYAPAGGSAGDSDWDATYSKGANSDDDVVRVFVIADQSDAIVLDLTGASLYDYNGNTGDALFVSGLAAKATVALDGQLTQSARPVYTNSAKITGAVNNSVSGVARAGAVVTISGASDLLFSVGNTDSFGSITTVADDDGFFTVSIYSNKTQTDSVVTITTPDVAVAKTQKISFNKPAVTAVKTITFAGPSYAGPGSTFSVVASLADVFGNGVDLDIAENSGAGNGVTDSGTFSVTYTGPGVNFGALPVVTDANGEAKVQVLLGSNDTGTATITVTWDRDGTATTYAAITASHTVTVGTAPASAEKVNAGSFLGYVAVYAKGHNGSTISWKIAGKWFKTTITSDYQVFQRKTVAVGMDVNVDIYIDGVKQLSKVVTTR